MKICEDCIKQDVCKFRKGVEKYEGSVELPKPLEPIIQCKYKRTEPSDWHYTITDSDTISSDTTTLIGCTATGTLIGGLN